MKRRSFVLALAAMPLAAHAQPAASQSADWQTIVGRDLRFRLEMPAPATETKAAEKEKGHVSERIAWASKRDGEMFDFDFVDYQPGWFSERDAKQMARDLHSADQTRNEAAKENNLHRRDTLELFDKDIHDRKGERGQEHVSHPLPQAARICGSNRGWLMHKEEAGEETRNYE